MKNTLNFFSVISFFCLVCFFFAIGISAQELEFEEIISTTSEDVSTSSDVIEEFVCPDCSEFSSPPPMFLEEEVEATTSDYSDLMSVLVPFQFLFLIAGDIILFLLSFFIVLKI